MRSKGIFQIVIGTLVSLTSFIINIRAKNSKFLLFLIIGLIFLGYGLLKLGLYFLTKPKNDSKKKSTEVHKKIVNLEMGRRTVINPTEIKQFNHNDSPFHTHHETIIACHSCNTKHYKNANFCQMCGSKMK